METYSLAQALSSQKRSLSLRSPKGHQAVVLDQGRVIHRGSASDLQAQLALLDSLLGIAGPKD